MMLVSEIAELLGYDYVGEDCEVRNISTAALAQEQEIAVCRRREDFLLTKARVLLSKPTLAATDKTLLLTFEDLDLSMIKVCKLLISRKILPDYSLPSTYALRPGGFYTGENCSISETACIQPGVVIGDCVRIGEGCVLEPYAVIGSGTILHDYVRIGFGSKIGADAFFHYYEDGKPRHFVGKGAVEIHNHTCIGSHTVVQRGTFSNTVIGVNTMIGNGIDIGHDVTIGDHCKIVSHTGIAGNATLGNHVLVYGRVSINNGVTVGNHVVVKATTSVTKSVRDGETVFGPFGRRFSHEMKQIAKLRHFLEGKDE